jgi:Flp pilus assembly protein TadG
MRHINFSIFRKNSDGVTAIEFALIFPIFILIIFSIIEFGMIMFVSSVMNSAALEASRYGITGSTYGKISSSGEPMTREELVQQTVADKMSILPFYNPTANPVKIELRSLGTIESPTAKQIIAQAGSGDEVIEYKIIYQWNLLSPVMYPILGEDGKYDISAKTIIKNESF